MHTAADLAAMLAASMTDVCRYLLPNGREQSGEWCAGSVHGEEGKSLKVRLSGHKAGVWRDFAGDVGGDALDLWASVRGISIADAMREVSDYFGLRPVEISSRSPRVIRSPKAATRADADAEVTEWLTQTRKLPAMSIAAYRVGAYKGAAAFPAFTADGKSVQYIKYRSITEKKMWSEKGGEPCLFGWQAIPPEAREVCIVEGELCALSMHAYGWPALSPTNGAGNLGWIDTEYDSLSRFDTIYLAYDMDSPGQEAVPKIAERLGLARCRHVLLPRKDVNECLVSGVDGEEIEAAIRNARTFDPPELGMSHAMADEVVNAMYAPVEDAGVHLPWDGAHGRFLFRPGELTILAGRNNSGKSQMVGQMTLSAMRQGQRCCIASMEFKPVKMLCRLAIQASGMRQPSEGYIRAIHQWYEDKLWHFSATGTAKAARIIEVFEYAAHRYGVNWFVVDNLSKCGLADDDYNGQKRLVEALGDFARDTNSHVILVHHLRKGDDSADREPSNSDVKGSGGIADMADNVLLLWRNRAKEKLMRMAEKVGARDEETEKKPDASLIVDKARNGDEEPRITLWFSRESYQFLEYQAQSPRQYVSWSALNREVS